MKRKLLVLSVEWRKIAGLIWILEAFGAVISLGS